MGSESTITYLSKYVSGGSDSLTHLIEARACCESCWTVLSSGFWGADVGLCDTHMQDLVSHCDKLCDPQPSGPTPPGPYTA